MSLVFLLFLFTMLALLGLLLAVTRGLRQWNRNYHRMRKRYGGTQLSGGVCSAHFFSNPSLTFDYGRTFCVLRNRRSFQFPERRQTELGMLWPNKKMKLEISTAPTRGWDFLPGGLKQVECENPHFQSIFYVSSNQPVEATKYLSGGVQWQLERLRQHTGNRQLHVILHRGKLVISKPGYLKEYQALEDFVGYGLELFDEMMLTNAVGIEFLHVGEAAIVEQAKCPICSDQIHENMVICHRCKTPHCHDCWEYNGQCATFACGETRYQRATASMVPL